MRLSPGEDAYARCKSRRLIAAVTSDASGDGCGTASQDRSRSAGDTKLWTGCEYEGLRLTRGEQSPEPLIERRQGVGVDVGIGATSTTTLALVNATVAEPRAGVENAKRLVVIDTGTSVQLGSVNSTVRSSVGLAPKNPSCAG